MRVALAAIQGMVIGGIYCIMRATPIGPIESVSAPACVRPGKVPTARAEIRPLSQRRRGRAHPP
ncbi:hypothetical protein, partial [Mycobacterium tuberculosis]